MQQKLHCLTFRLNFPTKIIQNGHPWTSICMPFIMLLIERTLHSIIYDFGHIQMIQSTELRYKEGIEMTLLKV